MIDRVGVTRVWLGIFVAAVFGSGVATGLLLQRYLDPPRVAEAPLRVISPPPGRLAALMADELDLTPEQRQQLEAVFESRRQHLRILRTDLHARFEREADEVGAEIQDILTPEQRERFDAIIVRRPSGQEPRRLFLARPEP